MKKLKVATGLIAIILLFWSSWSLAEEIENKIKDEHEIELVNKIKEIQKFLSSDTKPSQQNTQQDQSTTHEPHTTKLDANTVINKQWRNSLNRLKNQKVSDDKFVSEWLENKTQGKNKKLF